LALLPPNVKGKIPVTEPPLSEMALDVITLPAVSCNGNEAVSPLRVVEPETVNEESEGDNVEFKPDV
jgi:hypothetical protein